MATSESKPRVYSIFPDISQGKNGFHDWVTHSTSHFVEARRMTKHDPKQNIFIHEPKPIYNFGIWMLGIEMLE